MEVESDKENTYIRYISTWIKLDMNKKLELVSAVCSVTRSYHQYLGALWITLFRSRKRLSGRVKKDGQRKAECK